MEYAYTGPNDEDLAVAMTECDAEVTSWWLLVFVLVFSVCVFVAKGPLMVHTTKLYPSHDASTFYAFGRVMSGTCKVNG